MTPRLPNPSDFPPYVTVAIIPPPSSRPISNALILLHGLGDTNASFTTFARNISLPETVCIVLQGHTPLPFDIGGFHWGDDILFDPATGQMDIDAGFTKSRRVIEKDIIRSALGEKCGFQPREIMLFGYGQGGTAALAVAVASESELGGVISIGGPLASDTTPSQGKAKSPVMLLGGSSDTLITASALRRTKAVFSMVEYRKWERSGDGMPTNREEMLPIMQFFARRLRSRSGVPKGSVEIG